MSELLYFPRSLHPLLAAYQSTVQQTKHANNNRPRPVSYSRPCSNAARGCPADSTARLDLRHGAWLNSRALKWGPVGRFGHAIRQQVEVDAEVRRNR